MSKARVSLVFAHRPAEEKTWPYLGYDYKKRIDELTQNLKTCCPGVDFIPAVVHDGLEAEDLVKQAEDIDGYVVYIIGLWTGALNVITHSGYPVVLVDDLYGGSGELLVNFSQARKDKLPVVGVASSEFRDVIKATRLFEIIRAMKEATILDVTDMDVTDYSSKIKKLLGTQVIRMGSNELNAYYEKVDEEDARKWADKWINEALKIVEPSREEIVKSAKMYLALKKAMKDKGANAVTVDCLGLFYANKIPAYPCLAFFQLNNEGSTGVCESDLDSTVTQLLMRYLTGRPGYVSDPVIDTATNQIIYAHCVATNRVFGPEDLSNPYIIRSHSEDREGASVQSLMPLGETITTVKLNMLEKIMSIHQGKTVANVEEDRACRTKLAAEANAEKILDNWVWGGNWGWHRVTFYGDWKKQLRDLATLLGVELFQEDK